MPVFVVIFVTLLESPILQPSSIDPECLAIVRSKIVPELWKRSRQYGGFEVNCTFEAFQLHGLEPKELRLRRDRRYVVAEGGRLRSLESPGDGIVAVYATNDRYGFQVRREHASKEYSLHEIANDHLNLGDAGGLHSLSLTDLFARLSFAIGGVLLADIVAEESTQFELLEVRYVDNAFSRIRIAGHYRGPSDPTKWQGVYWAEVSTESPYYVVRSGVNDSESGSGSTEVFDITYHDLPGDFSPLPQFATRTSGSPEYGTLHTYSFGVPKLCTVEKSFFYLPHYRISEDVLRLDNPAANLWAVLLLLLMPLLLLLALRLWRLKETGPDVDV